MHIVLQIHFFNKPMLNPFTLQMMYAINAFLISNKQTVNFSQPFPFLSVSRHCWNFPFLAFVFVLLSSLSFSRFSFNATLMQRGSMHVCSCKMGENQTTLPDMQVYNYCSVQQLPSSSVCQTFLSYVSVNGTFLLTY